MCNPNKKRIFYFLCAAKNDAPKLKSTANIHRLATVGSVALEIWTEVLYTVQDEHVSQSVSDINLDRLRGLNYMIPIL